MALPALPDSRVGKGWISWCCIRPSDAPLDIELPHFISHGGRQDLTSFGEGHVCGRAHSRHHHCMGSGSGLRRSRGLIDSPISYTQVELQHCPKNSRSFLWRMLHYSLVIYLRAEATGSLPNGTL